MRRGPAVVPGPAWHAASPAEVAAACGTDPVRGLDPAGAAARLTRDGPNTLERRREEPWWAELLEVLLEPLQVLLLAVGLVYLLLGEVDDAVTILAIIGVVAAIEVANEARAKRAIAALSALAAPTATVVRGGQPVEVPASELVVGDLVLLRPGNRVPADLRLIETVALRVDESSLTGESIPVPKEAGAELEPGVELAERRTMAYLGTLVTAGRGRGIVVATGRGTEVGRIAALSAESREPPTPLQRSMRELAGWLVWVALGFSVLVPTLGVLLAGLPAEKMTLTGLTLAFATIPEELPILITIVLGIGAHRLARRKAIVKRLRAAETLGAVSVVATDKTGTLTENRVRLAEIFVAGRRHPAVAIEAHPVGRRLLRAAVLANDAVLTRSNGTIDIVGDPTDAAFLRAALEADRDPDQLRSLPVLAEFPFDDVRRRVSVVVAEAGARIVATKGAPEAVIGIASTVLTEGGPEPLDPATRDRLLAAAEAMAERGLRVLAVGDRTVPADGRLDAESVERELTFLGLVGLEDPPRQEAAGVVGALLAAGIDVTILTGDHPATARAIAERVGLGSSVPLRGRDLEPLSDDELVEALATTRVVARITPAQKLRVVRVLQARGEAVAVTGDGVNDAPALREATIGVAMGRAGTDVAREAADLVLADDNLATVAAAVEAGRVLFANLRKAVRFYLAAKVALVGASTVAVLLRLPVPFEPVQIIVMELFMDVGAATTFVAEPPEEDVMRRPPRDPRRRFFDRSIQVGILAGGATLAAVVLVPYLWVWRTGDGGPMAQSAAFVAWMLGSVVLAGHMRAEGTPLLPRGLASNRPFLLWALAAVLAVVGGLAVPALAGRLRLVGLGPETWVVVLASALGLPSWWELWKRRRRRASA